jgi:DNA-binding MarR family transcriptional regulator
VSRAELLDRPGGAPYDADMTKRPRKPTRRAAAAGDLVLSLLGTASAVEARLEAAVRPLGLSLAKAGVLMFLAQADEPLLLSELAEHEGCVRSNITQLVDRLERDGLVRRRADPGDGRSVRAVLTPAGRQAYAKATRALAEAQRAIVSALSATQVASLESALRNLAD